MKIINDIITGKDNLTVDMFKLMSILAIVIFFGLEISSFVTGRHFDEQAFAIGYGAISLSAAGSLKLKETTDPDSSDTTQIPPAKP